MSALDRFDDKEREAAMTSHDITTSIVVAGRAHRVFGNHVDVRRRLDAEGIVTFDGPDGEVTIDREQVEALA